MKKQIVCLTEAERERLKGVVTKGNSPVYKIRRANILLKADVNGLAWTDARIAEAFSAHPNTVAKIRKRFAEEGLKKALSARYELALPTGQSLMGNQRRT